MKLTLTIRNASLTGIVIALVLCVAVAVLSVLGFAEFNSLKQTTESYIACEDAADQLQKGSDYLTERARLFVSTSETVYMDEYFQEANVDQRRDQALKTLQHYCGSDSAAIGALKDALSKSKTLMEVEYHAMKLVCEANGIRQIDMPVSVSEHTLTEEEQAMSPEQKIARAAELVYDDQYQTTKDEITDSVNECVNRLVEESHDSQSSDTAAFVDIYLKIVVASILLVVVALLICLILMRMVIRPLGEYEQRIMHNELLPEKGPRELRLFAKTYNKVWNANQDAQKIIRHEAEHDGLTDLLNRRSFEKIMEIYGPGQDPFALILLDVDKFKDINDTYGHQAGDEALRRVAQAMRSSFRSVDYLCRYGGDEFAAIMVSTPPELRGIVEEKIGDLVGCIADTDAAVPLTLSIGIAFSTEGSGDVLRQADQALYHVKNNGRDGHCFYADLEKE